MSVHPRADAIDRLTNIHKNLVEIAEYIATDLVRQCAHRPSTEGEVDRHLLLRRDALRRLAVDEHRLKDVLGNMPHNWHADAVAADVICVIVALRKHVTIV
jgi:hypothetical protein